MKSSGAIATILVHISGSSSLKEKRSVIRGIVEGLGRVRSVAVSETGYKDRTDIAELTLAVVGDSPSYVDEELEKMMDGIESAGEVVVSVIRSIRY